MFDPTAFDNMKVVIEGALYDRDLDGEVVITDRNDIINTAKMSRHFDICFSLREGKTASAKLELQSQLVHLASELLPGSKTDQLAGCLVKLYFTFEVEDAEVDFHLLQTILNEIWGTSRKITLSIQQEHWQSAKKKSGMITVDFERVISEDHMDDLMEMTDVMMITLQKITEFLTK